MEEIIHVFPRQLRALCQAGFEKGIEAEELRLRIGQPVITIGKREEYFWNMDTGLLQKERNGSYCWSPEDMKEVLSRMSQYSMYALEEEIRNGFFTIQGGHRIGVAGKTICGQGRIEAMKNISGVSIRIAREKKNCARKMVDYIRLEGKVCNTLILSAPGIGKTTMLRDCIRLLSNGEDGQQGKKIGVVDERSEIAASFYGIPQNDLGIRTDVLDCCPKVEGMRMLLRSMSPHIIAVDELGSREDCQAVEEVLHCGCQILGTMHVGSIEELKEKAYLTHWLEHGFFQRFVLLSKGKEGERSFSVYNEKLEALC